MEKKKMKIISETINVPQRPVDQTVIEKINS